MKLNLKLLGFLSVAWVFFLLDRFFKFWIWDLESPLEIVSWGDFFVKVELYLNFDLALSLPFPRFLIVAVTLAILIILLGLGYKLLKKNDGYRVFFISLIILGAVSNLIDRIKDGYVTDYINIGFSGYSFPVFNVADIMVSLGAVGLLFWLYKKGKTLKSS